MIGVRFSLPATPSRSMALRMFSSVFSPMPGRSRSSLRSIAAARSSTLAIPSSSWSRTAVLGPTPGTLVRATNPGGNRARNSSSLAIDPVSTSSRILDAVLFPTPRNRVISTSDICSTGSG
jgi:hypothetical protein